MSARDDFPYIRRHAQADPTLARWRERMLAMMPEDRAELARALAEIDNLRSLKEAARMWFNTTGMEPEHTEATTVLRDAVAMNHVVYVSDGSAEIRNGSHS